MVREDADAARHPPTSVRPTTTGPAGTRERRKARLPLVVYILAVGTFLMYATRAPTLSSALTVAAFNLGTAVGSWIAGLALDAQLGAVGPATVGAVIGAMTLIPTTD